MKRFLASLLAVSMLFGTFVTTLAAVDTTDASLVEVDEDFSAYTSGTDIITAASDYEWSVTGGITSFNAASDGDNIVAEFNTVGQTTDGSVTLKFATGTTAVTGDISVEFDYKVNSSYSKGVQFNVQPSSGHGICVDLGLNLISYHDGSATQTAFSSLPKDEWYHLEIVAHTSSKTFDMYLTDKNGITQEAKGLTSRGDMSGGLLKLFMAGKRGDASVLFDNFLVGPYVASETGSGGNEEVDDNTPYTAPSALQDGDYIIFAGDSITASGGYPNYVQDFYATRYPDKRITYYNAACGGHTAEDILLRYDYDIKPHIGKANKIYIMLGTNDVKVFLYLPENEGNTSKDAEKQSRMLWAQENMEALLEKVTTDFPDAEVTVMLDSAIDTISDWEANGITSGTIFSDDVNDALRSLGARYKILCQTYGANYVDMNMHVLSAVEKQHEVGLDTSEWIVNKDRIHPNNKGQMVMAYALLKEEYKIEDEISNVWIDAAELSYTPQNCEIENVEGGTTGVSYTYLPYALPMYATGDYTVADKLVGWTDDLNREIIQVEGLEEGTYAVKLNGKTAMSASNTELAAGVNIGALSSNPNQTVSLTVYNKSKEKRDKESLVRHLMRVKTQMIKDGVDITDADAVVAALEGYDPSTSIGVSAQYALDTIEDFSNPMASVNAVLAEIAALEDELYALCVPVSYDVEIVKTADPVPGLLYEEDFEGMSASVTGWDAYTLTSDSNRVSLLDSADGIMTLKTDLDAKRNNVLSISDASEAKVVRADTNFDTGGVTNIRIELDVLPTDYSAITLTDNSSGNFTATSNNYFMYMCFINGNIQYRDTGSAVETTGKGWYNVGEWNKVVIELDTATPKYTVYINEKEILTRDTLKWGTGKAPSTLCVGSVYSLAKTCETQVDNIRIYDASYDVFTITDSGIYKGEEKIETPVAGDLITAGATFRNISGYEIDIKLVLAQYDASGALTNVAVKNATLTDDNALQIVTTDAITAGANSDFKVFIWSKSLSPV